MSLVSRCNPINNLGYLGLGCLQLENLKEEEAIEFMVESYKAGIRFFDTAAAYGSDRHNERLVGKGIAKIKSLIGEHSPLFFATKCGINFATIHSESEGYEGSPEEIRISVDASLKTLNVNQIPLLYIHRINPKCTEVEMKATFVALRELAEQNKVQYIGLSEPTRRQIEIADEVFQTSNLPYNPFAFVQSACSVASQRAFKNGVLEACQEKGIQFVSYTSMVRGLVDERLSKAFNLDEVAHMEPAAIIKKIKLTLNIPESDFRFFVGFFHEDVIKENIQCVLRFQKLAQSWSLPASQVALAWQKANHLIPIPGSVHIEQLRSNIEAMSLDLNDEHVHEINACFDSFAGNPNPPKMLDNDELN